MTKKQFAVKWLHAIILTVFTAGSIHLLVVGIASIVRHDPSLINPVNVLGLDLLFPELAHSVKALIVGWCVLIGLGVLYLYLLIHHKRYIAFISSTSSYQKVQKMRQLTLELQALLPEIMRTKNIRRDTKEPLRDRINKIITSYHDNEL